MSPPFEDLLFEAVSLNHEVIKHHLYRTTMYVERTRLRAFEVLAISAASGEVALSRASQTGLRVQDRLA